MHCMLVVLPDLSSVLAPLVCFADLYSNPLIVYLIICFSKDNFISFTCYFLGKGMSFLVHSCILIGEFYTNIKKWLNWEYL